MSLLFKDIEQSKVTLSKPKSDVKPSNSSPASSILKPVPIEKVKKEAEKRSSDKVGLGSDGWKYKFVLP